MNNKKFTPGHSIAHYLFEQSGTFKSAFAELGFSSYDYDIENQFGETDIQCDIFDEIVKCYMGRKSIFDNINSDDIVMAFFPCTYFANYNRQMLSHTSINYKGKSPRQVTRSIANRAKEVCRYFIMINRLLCIALEKGFPMVIENPCTGSLIYSTFYRKPDIIDSNRQEMGDEFRKPTMYWFINFKPAASIENAGYFSTVQKRKVMNASTKIGRSLITKKYAINFIRTTILGEHDSHKNLILFN